MPTLQQIESFRKKARAKGFSEAQISAEIARKIREESVAATSAPSSQDTASEPTVASDIGATEPKKKGLLRTVGESIVKPAVNAAKFLGEAGAQAGRALTDEGISLANPLAKTQKFKVDEYDQSIKSLSAQSRDLIQQSKKTTDKEEKKRLLEQSRQIDAQIEELGSKAGKVGGQKTTFFEDEKNLSGRAKIAETGARRTAGAMSYVVPGGAGVKGAITAGAAAGGLSALSEDNSSAVDVGMGALTGAAIGGSFSLAGKGLRWVSNTGPAKTIKKGLLTKIGKSLREDATQIKVNPSIYGAKKEKLIQETLDSLKITGGPQEKYEQLEPAMQALSKKISDVIEENPDISVNVRDLAESFETKLRSELRTKSITSKAAREEIKGYLSDLLKEVDVPNSSGTGLTTTKNVSPGLKQTKDLVIAEGVPLKNLFKLKKIVNKDYGSIADKLERGTPLTDREKVVFYARQVLDEAITKANPELKNLTIMQSHLFDAARPLSAARNTVPTFRILGNTVPKQRMLQDKFGEILVTLDDKTQKLAKKWIDPLTGSLRQGAEELSNAEKSTLGTVLRNITTIGSVSDGFDPNSDGSNADQDVGQEQESSNIDSQINQDTPVVDKQIIPPENKNNPFSGFTKQEVLSAALASGAKSADLEEIGYLYDKLSETDNWQGQKTNDLISTRKSLSDQGLDTSAIDAELSKRGIKSTGKGKQKEPTEMERKFANAAGAAQKSLDLLDTGKAKTGLGQKTLGAIGEKLDTNSPSQQRYRASLALARTAARNALLGANMSEKELESISAFIPEFDDGPEVAKEKLRTFIELMNDFSGT